MDDNIKARLFGRLVSENDLNTILRTRKQNYIFETIHCKEDEREKNRIHYEEIGWEFDRNFSNSIKMRMPKTHFQAFEDKVWILFAQMGFNFMNAGNNLKIPYDKSNSSQQIDVFAKDDETALYVECKSSQKKGVSSLKEVLEAWATKKQGVERSINELFPNQLLKKKFILATENLELSDIDKERLNAIGGIHFDESKIDYYLEMFSQIGTASRYQLLSDLFEGSNIPELDMRVPAIRGKMGGHTYYSFSIEPEKLLKIGYVLHRSKANEEMMPTYQRLIKKKRLKEIRSFLDNEHTPGFFPNSIIVNINTDNKMLKWEPANTQVEDAISKLGVLHLPKKYKSAYIIDGQHRLYGYSESRFRNNNSIPVVAFLNLSGEEQVNLFMQINENQTAVPKTLRETLLSDLCWASKDLREQQEALCSRISLWLGERNGSPFCNYISVGGDNKVLTPTAIKTGIKKTRFLGKVSSNSIEELGSFFNGDLNDTLERLYKFLNLSFTFLTSRLSVDFNEGKNSFLFVNKGITATIMLLGDIVDFLKETENLDFSLVKSEEYMSHVYKFLTPLVDFVTNVDVETKGRMMELKGAGAPTKYWRKIQIETRNRFKFFSPAGLEEYIENEERALNSDTYKLIRDIEKYMRLDFKTKLVDKFTDEWAWKSGVPVKIQEAAEIEMKRKNRTRPKSEETEEWDNLNLINYREIAEANWTFTNNDKTRDRFFEIHYTRPGDEKLNKADQTKWFVELNNIRRIVSHASSDQVTENQYLFVKDLHDWMIKKEKMIINQ